MSHSFGIAAAFIVLLMILVLLTNWRDRGRAMFAYFLINVAAFPYLTSLISFLLESPQQEKSEYWATAPWFMILGGPSYLRHSAVLAVITGLVYVLTPGDNAKRARWALGCFTILAVALLSYISRQQI